MRVHDKMEHLVLEGLGTVTKAGGAGGGSGAGGMGSSDFTPGSIRVTTGAGRGSAALMLGFSGAVRETFSTEACLATRGSLRLMLTEDTAGATVRGA